MFLIYGGETEFIVRGYTDVNFQINRDDLRSQSRFVFVLNGDVVSLKSFKQDTTTDSTIKVEYIAASETTKKGVWIKKFMIELLVIPSASGLLELYCDNNGAIAQANKSRSH
jgi:hypothetical protein